MRAPVFLMVSSWVQLWVFQLSLQPGDFLSLSLGLVPLLVILSPLVPFPLSFVLATLLVTHTEFIFVFP